MKLVIERDFLIENTENRLSTVQTLVLHFLLDQLEILHNRNGFLLNLEFLLAMERGEVFMLSFNSV